MDLLRLIIHYGMHYLMPFVIALLFFKKDFWKASLLMVAANLIDLDHLMANPIFNPNRCSIGFHLLHSHVAIVFYTVLLVIPKMRIIAIGLLLHILTDFIDCLWI